MGIRAHLADKPHFVYRCYDADDNLLYVGCTVDVERRFYKHRRRSGPWVKSIARITTEEFPNAAEAYAAEGAATMLEGPIHNKRLGVDVADEDQPEGFYSSSQVCRDAGITYRQLDYWCRQGHIQPTANPAAGSGTRRVFTGDDIIKARILAEAARIVAACADGSVWEMVADGRLWCVDVSEHKPKERAA